MKETRAPELTWNVVSFVCVNLEVGPNVVDPGEEVESVPGALARRLLPRLHPVDANLLLVQSRPQLEASSTTQIHMDVLTTILQ